MVESTHHDHWWQDLGCSVWFEPFKGLMHGSPVSHNKGKFWPSDLSDGAVTDEQEVLLQVPWTVLTGPWSVNFGGQGFTLEPSTTPRHRVCDLCGKLLSLSCSSCCGFVWIFPESFHLRWPSCQHKWFLKGEKRSGKKSGSAKIRP